ADCRSHRHMDQPCWYRGWIQQTRRDHRREPRAAFVSFAICKLRSTLSAKSSGCAALAPATVRGGDRAVATRRATPPGKTLRHRLQPPLAPAVLLTIRARGPAGVDRIGGRGGGNLP